MLYVAAFKRRAATDAGTAAPASAVPASDDPCATAAVSRVSLSLAERVELSSLLRDLAAFQSTATMVLAATGEDMGAAGDWSIVGGSDGAAAGAGSGSGGGGGGGGGADVVNDDCERLVARTRALMSRWLRNAAVASVLSGPEPVVVLGDAALSQLPLECTSDHHLPRAALACASFSPSLLPCFHLPIVISVSISPCLLSPRCSALHVLPHSPMRILSPFVTWLLQVCRS